MISPEEFSHKSKTPSTGKDDVPKQFDFTTTTKSQQTLNFLKEAINCKLIAIAPALTTFLALDNPTPYDVSDLQDKMSKLFNQFELLESKFIEATDLSATQHKAMGDAIIKLHEEVEDATNRVKTAIRENTVASTAAPEIRYKHVLGNKPFLLSPDHTLAEFRVWKKAFATYYRTSHMELITIMDQQVHLLQCLNPWLQAQLQAKIADTTPIFGRNNEPNCLELLQSLLGHCIYNTMISPEEKIDSPQSKTPSIAKDDVPKRFAYVKPKKLGPKCLFLKKFLIGCAATFVGMAVVGIVSLYGDISKSHSLFFSMPNPSCKNVKTYLIFIKIICQKIKNHCSIGKIPFIFQRVQHLIVNQHQQQWTQLT